MKATGMTRRIDDLGRIVIPKEIRRQLKIQEGQSIEIFLNEQKDIVLRKYSELSALDKQTYTILETLFDTYFISVLLTDRQEIRYAVSKQKELYEGKALSSQMTELISKRKISRGSHYEIVEDFREQKEALVYPLVMEGDLIGSLIFMAEKVPLSSVNDEIFRYTASLLLRAMV